MPVIQSKLDPRSAEFQSNAAAMAQQVDDLRDKVELISEGGGQSAR